MASGRSRHAAQSSRRGVGRVSSSVGYRVPGILYRFFEDKSNHVEGFDISYIERVSPSISVFSMQILNKSIVVLIVIIFHLCRLLTMCGTLFIQSDPLSKSYVSIISFFSQFIGIVYIELEPQHRYYCSFEVRIVEEQSGVFVGDKNGSGESHFCIPALPRVHALIVRSAFPLETVLAGRFFSSCPERRPGLAFVAFFFPADFVLLEACDSRQNSGLRNARTCVPGSG